MKVLEYLNNIVNQGFSEYEALEQLNVELGVKVRHEDEYGLYVLNYCQIESPKTDDIVKECRSLVLGYCLIENRFKVISRAFDRFFNHGEVEQEEEIYNLVANEKLDGSLVTVFHYNGEWLYRTRSMIMPVDMSVNGFETTWKDLIEDALGNISDKCSELNTELSLIFEVVAPENRVVVRYPERKAVLLAMRNNYTGYYFENSWCDSVASFRDWSRPKQYTFNDLEEVMTAVKDLPNLEEGYVMYCGKTNRPIKKIKNPAYVAAHHLRGEGLNPKRIMDLIIMNEVAEYLAIFPEDASMFEPYQTAMVNMNNEIMNLSQAVRGITDQKEYALKVKDYPVSGILFSMKKGVDINDAWNELNQNYKYRLIESYL